MTALTGTATWDGTGPDGQRRPVGTTDGGPDGPVIRRHRLGAELRRLREARSLRIGDVTGELGVAQSTLSRIETGLAPARTSYVNALLSAYGVTDPDERRRLTDLAREGQRKGWWTAYEHLLPPGAGSYLSLEADACQIRAYAVQTVPGLLQTSDYTAAAYQAARPDLTEADAAALATVALRRKEALCDGRHHLHAIIDESALSRVVGPAPVMTAQLNHLAALAADPRVTVQIVTLSALHPVLSAPMTLLSFPDPEDPDMACRSGADGQILISKHTAIVAPMLGTFRALARAALSAQASADLISAMARQQ
jgi:transcriptional regulator with XRE-family HTH domain